MRRVEGGVRCANAWTGSEQGLELARDERASIDLSKAADIVKTRVAGFN